MDTIPRNNLKTDSRTLLQIFILQLLLQMSSSSNCDVEFSYSEELNTNGFKVVCSNIQKGQEEVIRSISAHNAFFLDIRNATLTDDVPDLFENVPKIKKLSIEDSRILITGQVDFFAKLEILQYLSLRNTELKEIGEKTFSSLSRVRTLQLENNNIVSIARNSFKLGNLENFEFINNELNDISRINFCDLSNIKSLNFRQNRIKSLKSDLYNCPTPSDKSFHEDNHFNIESIDLSYNEISSIRGVFKSFTDLNRLNLGNNAIVHISSTDLENMMELNYLNLANNSIVGIDLTAFDKLYRLEKIDLSNNRIIHIQLKSLKQLSEINLAHNKLKFEDVQGISNLPQLDTLDLSFNELNGTSSFFNQFPSLITLNLNGNNIILENEMFMNLTRLEKLHLRQNAIYHLPDHIFDRMISLLELDISENKLEFIDSIHVFSSLTNLQYLNLSHNYLRSLNYSTFVNLDNVEVLDISGNQLKFLDYSLIINSMRALETMNIKDNLFSCNYLRSVIKYFAWKGINYHDNFTFYEEENIGGIHCQEDIPINENDVTKIPSSENTIVLVIALNLAILSIFVVIMLIVLKYYKFYKLRKYQCEQFELIED